MRSNIAEAVAEGLIRAASTFRADKKAAYAAAIKKEENELARWTMQTILDNAEAAEKNRSPLCDDSGIPHLLLEVGDDFALTGTLLDEIGRGVREGLRRLPGRPMAVTGDDDERLSQRGALSPDSAAVEPAPVLLRRTRGSGARLHILMFGGGPAIRAKTLRVFHRHSEETVYDEIVSWAAESCAMLGCTPATVGIGIGRSHYEAACLMLEAFVDGRYDSQSLREKELCRRINETGTGPLGLGGRTSVLAAFLKVGPQRASGVRIVCMRPSCCFEPRIATVEL